MAARSMKTRIDEPTRQKIQATQIVNRLTKHVLGELPSGKEMTPSQVTAGLGLLKKVIPDLAAVTLSGDPEAPLVTEIRRTVVDPVQRDEEDEGEGDK